MTILRCDGLDAANPLHMLAALGLLRLADRVHPGARLGFFRAGAAWRPVIEVAQGREELIVDLAAWLVVLGQRACDDPKPLQARVRTSKERVKKATEAVKECAKKARAEAKARKLDKVEAARLAAEAIAPLERERQVLAAELAAASRTLALANGLGVAHLGDIIGVEPDIFRQFGEAALRALGDGPVGAGPAPGDPVLVVGQLPALACDQVCDGDKVRPTPYSFGNGASGQCLLKSFLACAAEVTPERLAASLAGGEARWVEGGGLSLNWDPGDLRSYAFAWDNPESVTKRVDVAANALAYLGLGLLPVAPSGRSLHAVGWGHGDAWTWPLWEVSLPLDVVTSLLADPVMVAKQPDLAALAARGIAELRRCARVNPSGKRAFFAPSQPL